MANPDSRGATLNECEKSLRTARTLQSELKIAEEMELKLLKALNEEKNVALTVEKELHNLNCQHQTNLQLLKAKQEQALNQQKQAFWDEKEKMIRKHSSSKMEVRKCVQATTECRAKLQAIIEAEFAIPRTGARAKQDKFVDKKMNKNALEPKEIGLVAEAKGTAKIKRERPLDWQEKLQGLEDDVAVAAKVSRAIRSVHAQSMDAAEAMKPQTNIPAFTMPPRERPSRHSTSPYSNYGRGHETSKERKARLAHL